MPRTTADGGEEVIVQIVSHRRRVPTDSVTTFGDENTTVLHNGYCHSSAMSALRASSATDLQNGKRQRSAMERER